MSFLTSTAEHSAKDMWVITSSIFNVKANWQPAWDFLVLLKISRNILQNLLEGYFPSETILDPVRFL